MLIFKIIDGVNFQDINAPSIIKYCNMYALKKFRWENPHLQPHDYSGDNSDFLSLKPPGH